MTEEMASAMLPATSTPLIIDSLAGAVSAASAHAIRNPLAGASALVQLMQLRGTGDKEQLDKIAGELDRVSAAVDATLMLFSDAVEASDSRTDLSVFCPDCGFSVPCLVVGKLDDFKAIFLSLEDALSSEIQAKISQEKTYVEWAISGEPPGPEEALKLSAIAIYMQATGGSFCYDKNRERWILRIKRVKG